MGAKSSKPSYRYQIDEEISRRMMVQREVQMSVNIAKARDAIQIFGSAYLTLVSGISIAKLAGKHVPPIAGVPVVIGGLALGNMADLAYGNKLARVSKEAEYIMEYERSRLAAISAHEAGARVTILYTRGEGGNV